MTKISTARRAFKPARLPSLQKRASAFVALFAVLLLLAPLRALAGPAAEFIHVNFQDVSDANGQTVRIIYGEIKNVGDVALANPMIKLIDPSLPAGAKAPRVGLGEVHFLPVGGIAPFKMMHTAGGPGEYKFELDNIFPWDKPIASSGLEFVDAHIGLMLAPADTKAAGTVLIEARIRNASDQTTDDDIERLVATFYDGEGKVVAVASTLSHGSAIAPGKPGGYLRLQAPLLGESFTAYRLTAQVGDKHYTSAYREVGRVALSLKDISEQGLSENGTPLELEITNHAAIPVWPCWAGMARGGAYAQADGSAVLPGESRRFSDPFKKKRTASAGCWFPHEPAK